MRHSTHRMGLDVKKTSLRLLLQPRGATTAVTVAVPPTTQLVLARPCSGRLEMVIYQLLLRLQF